jgi:poly(A) polymerase/tRNA nucleotidyltransferase (CCA-adding enzyme)
LAEEDAAILIDRAWLAGGAAADWTALRTRLAALPRPVFPLEGRDVLALGVPEGPRVGSLLRSVRRWWLDGGCTASEADCRGELMRRMKASPG